ncbi:MAG: hypothetical protein IT211_03525 [Armatimonadetes bacterium]|nr:hypothetical protein [Armatimonadota bacterium]
MDTTRTTQPSDVPLNRLREIERMSVRAWNACHNNGITTLSALLQHYQSHGTFAKFRNVGRLTETELINICGKYLQDGNTQRLQTIEQKAAELDLNIQSPNWSLWSDLELAVLNNELRERVENFSTAAKDLLRFIVPVVDRDIRAFDGYVTALQQKVGFTPTDRLTLQELQAARAELIQVSETFSIHLPEEEAFQRFTTLWSERFGFTKEELLVYRQAFIARQFPLFHFLNELLFVRGKGLQDHIQKTMIGRYPFRLGDQKRRLEDIGSEVGLTRERIRQLAGTIPGRVQIVVASLGPIADYLCYQPLFYQGRDLLIIDDDYAQYVNASEGVSFTAGFMVVVLETFLKEHYDRLEEDFDGATDYLVHSELTEVFDFDAFLRRMAERLEQRIARPYTLNLLEEVEANLKTPSRLRLRRACAVCELLAHKEFGITVTDAGELLFERNTKKRLDEHIADLLLESGKPLHVEELSARLNQLFPELGTSAESVRGTVLRFPERFTRYDTGSTYGLSEWEAAGQKFKSGTFADIAEEFLVSCDTPRHWAEVAEYVMRYRTTTERTVFGTLKADMAGRFYFYDGGMVGLTTKPYEGVDTNYRALHPHSYQNLRHIIKDMGGDVDTAKLVTYCMLQYRLPQQQAAYFVHRVLAEEPQESEGVVES